SARRQHDRPGERRAYVDDALDQHGVERTTFLIRQDGTIANIWQKVKVQGHAETVLEAVRNLAA
ncbi:hypothetical protein ACC702_39175, partial [Rhizobium ruizarguesonis]